MKSAYAPAGMTAEHATRVAEVLQRRLATLIDLSMTLKHVHWNVVGSGFIATHELMDVQHETVRELIDETAERIATLGGIAAGLPNQVVRYRDGGEDYALGRAPTLAHLGALDKAYEIATEGHRRTLDEIDEMDPVSTDMLTDQTGKLETSHWFIRAHLTDVEGELSTANAVDELDAAVQAVRAPGPAEEPA